MVNFRMSFQFKFAWVFPVLTLVMNLIKAEGAVSHVSFSKSAGGKFSYEILHDPAKGGHRLSSSPLGFGTFDTHQIHSFPVKTKSSLLHAKPSAFTDNDVGLTHFFNGHLAGPIPPELKSYFRSSKPSHYGDENTAAVKSRRPPATVKLPAAAAHGLNHFPRLIVPSLKRPSGATLYNDYPSRAPSSVKNFNKNKFISNEPVIPWFIDPIHGTGLKFGLWSPALGPPIRKPKGYHLHKSFRPGKLMGGFRPSYGPPGFKKPSYVDFAFYPSPSYFKLFDKYEEDLIPYADVAGSFSSLHGSSASGPNDDSHDVSNNLPFELPTSIVRQNNLALPIVLNSQESSLLDGQGEPQEVTYHGFTGEDYRRLSPLDSPKLTPTTATSLRTLVPPEPDVSPSELSATAVKSSSTESSSPEAEPSPTPKNNQK